jgi:hypothetical protein
MIGKRSDFERKPRDFYPTPAAAVAPLIPHLPQAWFAYHEPCAGDYALVKHIAALAPHALCLEAGDVEPQHAAVIKRDAMDARMCHGEMFITNPPWDRKVLHPLIAHLSSIAPTWLLIDADWMHTIQAGPYLKHCVRIVSIGRVKWIEGSKMTGKENCCWYLFDAAWTGQTEFIGR